MSLKTLNGEMDKVREYATQYSKQQMASMVQNQQMSLEDATMAGAMIDRIAATANKPPTEDVAHKINPYLAGGAPPPPQAAPQAPPEAPPPPPEQPPQAAAEGGLMHLAHGGHVHSGLAGLESNIPEMAGGGIVAFAGGGTYGDKLPGGPIPQQPLNIPAQQTPQGIMAAQDSMNNLAGVDPNFFANQQASLAQDRQDLSAEKEKAIGQGMFLFGAKLLGAREGQLFSTASEAAQQALLQIGQAHKDILAQDQEIKKASRSLNAAEHQFKLNKSSDALNQIQANKDRIEAAKNEQIKSSNALELGQASAFMELYKSNADNAMKLLVAKINQASTSSSEGERNRRIAEAIMTPAGWNNPITGEVEQGPDALSKFYGRVVTASDKGKQDTHGTVSATAIYGASDKYQDPGERLKGTNALYNSQFPAAGATPGQPATSGIVSFDSLK